LEKAWKNYYNQKRKKDMNKVAIYGYDGCFFPDFIGKNDKISVYSKKKLSSALPENIYEKDIYSDLKDIGWVGVNITVLMNESLTAVLAGYPGKSELVFLRLNRFKYYPVIVLGLLRRLWFKQVKNITVVYDNSTKTFWLRLQNNLRKERATSFSEKLGVDGLIEYMNANNIHYSIPRFYSKLPSLYREGGDLDILVSDADSIKLHKYISNNPGRIPIDVWPCDAPIYNGISYYPPKLARKILEASVISECFGSAKVPNDDEALLSFAYHIVFHKGMQSGLANDFTNEDIDEKNKYLIELKRLAEKANVKLSYTLESIADFLEENEWVPQKDTIFKISQWNVWVREHYSKKYQSIGLSTYMIIVKKNGIKEFESGVVENIAVSNGFQVVEKARLSDKDATRVGQTLRGGVWNEHSPSANKFDFYPAAYLIVTDSFDRVGGMTLLKSKIRNQIDIDVVPPSKIHSTDDAYETSEYLSVIEKSTFEAAKDKVELLSLTAGSSVSAPFFLRYKYKLQDFQRTLLENITNYITKI